MDTCAGRTAVSDFLRRGETACAATADEGEQLDQSGCAISDADAPGTEPNQRERPAVAAGDGTKDGEGESRLVASSATTSTPVTASPSALTSAPSTAVTATTTAAFTRAGFIDYHIAAHEILAVEGLDNAGRFFIVVDFNEGEPTRLSSLAVRH
jgi:hypothetical protein